MKYLLILILMAYGCSDELIRKEMPLDNYGYERDHYETRDLEYLLGNAEMGALSNNKGLGFEKLWFTDMWSDKVWRKSLQGPLLINDELEKRNFTNAEFIHKLSIKNGIQDTKVVFPDGVGYESTLFFSKRDKHLVVINIKNISLNAASFNWRLSLPLDEFIVTHPTDKVLNAETNIDDLYTKAAWSLKSTTPIIKQDNEYHISLKPGEETTLLYSVATHWDGENYFEQANQSISLNQTFEEIKQDQMRAWDEQWSSIASIIIPDGEYAKWFYRSIALLYWTSGADQFCAGEKQFSIPDVDWHMHPFTYGQGGGWSVWAFTQLGDKQRAMNIAKWHYEPEALKDNVKILFPELGPVKLQYRGQDKGVHTYLTEYNPNAIAFGHEVDTERHNITYTTDRHWDLQRHVDGYAAKFYQLIDRYYPDKQFAKDYTYPVLRGTAELYSSLAKWDGERQIYFLPPLLSVAENIMEKSVLDAVLAAKWTLKTASEYADEMNVDSNLSDKWKKVHEKLFVPQTEETYLEYLDDKQNRVGGGYFGIRAFEYFGYPFLEQMKDLDQNKIRKALDSAWERNNRGEGMISFILNWFALTESYLGNGQMAYNMSNLNTALVDSSGTCLVEAIEKYDDGSDRRINKYFLTGNTSLILLPISMIVHSYDNKVKLFPGIPKEWNRVEVYDLPIENGLKMSGLYESREIKKVEIMEDNEILFRTNDAKSLEVKLNDGQYFIEEIKN